MWIITSRCQMVGLKCFSQVVLVVAGLFSLSASATVARFDFDFGGQPAGSLFIDLLEADAPITVSNFLNYVDDGAGNRRYDGTLVHRRAPGFVIQGGGYIYDPGLGPFGPVSAPHIAVDDPIQNEFDVARSNIQGTIAMAKLGNDPDSATSEWFINVVDNSDNLDNQNGGFTVFGTVLGNGMDLVNTIDALNSVNAGGAFTVLPVLDSLAIVDEANIVTLSEVVIDPPVTILSDSSEVDFGRIIVNGAPVTHTLTVQNLGMPGRDLVIGSINPSDLAAPFDFSLGGDRCSGQTLGFEGECTIELEVAPVSVGDFQDSFEIPSNDAGQPVLEIVVRATGASTTPVLDVMPATLDFGVAGTGSPQELTVTVSNLGGGQLQPLQPLISGTDSDAFSISANTCDNALLDIGQTCALTVRLLSFSLGSLAAVLDIPADPGNQVIQVALSANVTELLQSDIQLPESIMVPDIRIGSSGVGTLDISNDGVDGLYISAIEVLGVDAAVFSLAATDSCIDMVIDSQSQACRQQVDFNPVETGEFIAILRVSSNDPESPVVDVPISATASIDSDGVADSIEQGAPNNGDGNLDGVPDSQQEDVASLLDVNGNYVTLETSNGTLVNVQAIPPSSLRDIPVIDSGSLEFTSGFFWFTVDNVATEPDGSGGAASVTLHFSQGQPANSYFKFGRLPNESPFAVREHWYQFPFDQNTQTGAEFVGNTVVLHLVDGGGGDNDLAVNGRIVDPGGPAVLTVSGSGSGGGGGGCSLRQNVAAGGDRVVYDFFVLMAGLLIFRIITNGAVAVRG